MPETADLEHAYSAKVFTEASADPDIPMERYSDVGELLDLLNETGGSFSLDSLTEEGRLPPNIVIVEDEPELSELFGSRLVELGYPAKSLHALTVSSGALQFAITHGVAMAFIDIKLDGGRVEDVVYTSGMEVLKAIKQSSPGAKAVLMSGFGTYQMARRGILELGASFYLSKPFRLTDVVKLVQWAVRSRQA